MYRFLLIFLLALTVLINDTKGQDLVQLSGVVMTSDSLNGLPYASVIIKGTGRGTISDYKGYFSLVAAEGDTIVFKSLGFVPAEVLVPDSLRRSKYSVIQLLTRDTFYIATTVIYPWPTKEQFKQAFLALNIPDDDLERARRNLEREILAEKGETLAYDANESADRYFRSEAEKFNYAGQTPPMNIFNPIAWSKFIEAWKRGDFKNKDD